MTTYTMTRFEEVLTAHTIEIEADSPEEAEEKYNQMRYDGSFYELAELASESVTNGWDEISYIDDNGEEITATL